METTTGHLWTTEVTVANHSIVGSDESNQSTLEDDWRQRRCGAMPAARMREKFSPVLLGICGIALITILGNMAMYALILTNKRFRKQRSNIFMMAVGLGDVLFMLFFVASNLFFYPSIHASPVGCKVWNIINAFLFCLPWYIFLGIMLDRLFAVTRPIKYREFREVSAVPVIAICWVVALVPTIPLWFDETIEELMTGEKNCKCFFPLQNKLWVGWQSLISFLIPVLIILASWTIMGYSILNKKVHRLLKAVTIKSIIVTAFFLVCVSPFCVVFFKASFDPPKGNKLNSHTLPFLLLNSMIQPYLYVTINTNLRKKILQLICRRKEEVVPLDNLESSTEKSSR